LCDYIIINSFRNFDKINVHVLEVNKYLLIVLKIEKENDVIFVTSLSDSIHHFASSGWLGNFKNKKRIFCFIIKFVGFRFKDFIFKICFRNSGFRNLKSSGEEETIPSGNTVTFFFQTAKCLIVTSWRVWIFSFLKVLWLMTQMLFRR
jgi:hypothetical protein